MADAYLKVKDNGASGLELVRESVGDAESSLGLAALDGRINVINNLIDYGYADEEVIGNTGGYLKDRISVSRKNTQIKVNLPSGASTGVIRVKISGEILGAAKNADVEAWTTGLALTDGHKYRASMTYISGTVTGDNAPVLSVYKVGAHTTDGSAAQNGNTYSREFTATNTAVNLAIYIFTGTVLTDAVYQIILEDITNGDIREVLNSLAEDGDAWEE